MSQKFKSDIETQAGLIDSFGFSGSAGQILSSTGTKTEWITPPQSPGGGGSSQVFYFNGGTASSVGGYYQMSPVANTSTAADFTINANGYIASFLTDVNSPNQLNIPAGNWNFEIYFSASSGGGSPSFYVELYKYSSSTFTLIASSSASPEGITNGTVIDAYFTPLAVPATTLLATDRLAVRVYVTHSGRTITMHTQNGHLSEVITTFSTGLTALNGLTEQVQYFATGVGGTDFNIASAVNTHTFNLPTASATNRGALSSADWITFNSKANASGTTNYVSKFTGATTLGNSQIFDNGTNVGIGTPGPVDKLEVNGGIRSTGLNGFTRINDGVLSASRADGLYLIQEANAPMIMWTNNTERMRITSAGNVGIGTSSPSALLSLLTANNYAAIFNTSTIPSSNTAIGIGGYTTGLGTSGGTIRVYHNYGSTTATQMAFEVNGNYEAMRIMDTGNVGIGTSSPSGLLHLYKNNSPVVLRLQSASPYSYPGDFSIQTGGYGSNDFVIYDNISSVERLYINAAGNVGIGTSTPTQLLHVAGNARVTGSIYDSSNSPGTSGQILSSTVTGTAWVAGGGGGSTPIKLTSQTLAVGSWTLVGDYYTYAFSNINVDTTSDISVTPQNASYLIAYNAQVLPFVGVSAGVATFYSQFPPQNDMVVDIVITQTT